MASPGRIVTGLACTVLVGLAPVCADDRDDSSAALLAAFGAAIQADAEGLAEGVLPTAVVAVEGLGVLDRPSALAGALAAGTSVEITDIQLMNRAGFLRGTLTVPDGKPALAFHAVCLKEEGRWQVAALLALRGAIVDTGPAGLEDIIADIEAEGDTGMQAALPYLHAGPCIGLLGLPNGPVVLWGSEVFRASVADWAPPEETRSRGPRVLRVSEDLACATFDSSVRTGPDWLDLRNVVAFARQDDRWRIIIFAALVE